MPNILPFNENITSCTDGPLLQQYFSEELIEYIRITGTNPLENRHQQVSVLFFDIRNSTGIAEQLAPKLFAQFLNDILTDIMDLVCGARGSVNKILGDGLLAVFGAPVSSGDDAFNAVKVGLEVQNYLQTYNDVRPDYLIHPIEAGVGIATGQVFAGIIGSVHRQEYTVLGDPVNVASRLESLTRYCPDKVLMDEGTYQLIKGRFDTLRTYKSQVRGKSKPIKVYGIMP
jgi:class 3 adenylate cyclase